MALSGFLGTCSCPEPSRAGAAHRAARVSQGRALGAASGVRRRTLGRACSRREDVGVRPVTRLRRRAWDTGRPLSRSRRWCQPLPFRPCSRESSQDTRPGTWDQEKVQRRGTSSAPASDPPRAGRGGCFWEAAANVVEGWRGDLPSLFRLFFQNWTSLWFKNLLGCCRVPSAVAP